MLVCGFDTELTFQKLEDACILLSRGVDPILPPTPTGSAPPGTAMCPTAAACARCSGRATGRRPLVGGQATAGRWCCWPWSARAVSRAQTLVVGDRLYTDIACGVNAGVDTALVLSGESTRETLAASDVQPTWVLRDVAELLEQMQREEQD